MLSQHTCEPYKKIAMPKVDNNVSVLKTSILEGWWLMKMDLGPDKLPVRFSYNKVNETITIYNAEERIVCDGVKFRNDSLFFRAPVFQNEFRLKIEDTKHLSGSWHNLNKSDYKISCSAVFHSEENTSIIGGDFEIKKFEARFSQGTSDAYNAIGQFKFFKPKNLHNSIYTPITGTFMTETGDYRYLEGNLVNSNLTLSCFDGSHAFLFKAKYNKSGDTLRGMFYSGNHHAEPWVAWLNSSVKLRNPDSLTLLKSGYDAIRFTFPSVENKPVSFPSDRFKDKVTIVEIMGSWCPNCMDETVYMQGLKSKYSEKGLEVVALCYERTDDFTKSAEAVKRMKQTLKADYAFLIAGVSNKKKAAETLPMLNEIFSYPTTIFIDRKGKVRKIFTGFYGPSTGSYYTHYSEETEHFIQLLLSE